MKTKVNGNSMAQELAHPARGEMPEIPSPDFLDMKTFDKLAKHRLDAVAHVGQLPGKAKGFSFGAFVRSEEVQALISQSLHQLRLPIVAVGQRPTLLAKQQRLSGNRVMKIGRSQPNICKNTGPLQTNVGTKP